MTLFGRWTLTRKAAPSTLVGVSDGRGGWWPIVRESFAGAWQANVEVELQNVLTFAALYACATLIASDIGKLRIKLVERVSSATGDIWLETTNPAYTPVLRKPNGYQNRIGFLVQWITSKLIHGNAYILKGRDARGVVTALYVLDPLRVKVLLAPDGSVWYELARDPLAGIGAPDGRGLVVPAREMIHDLAVPFYHPLVGISPISACGLAAVQGLRIQTNSARFFASGSNPGGVLTAPGSIAPDTATRLKEYWDANFTGENVGKVAVLGDGLKYEPMSVNAVDAQLIDQLKWTAENVCTAFHVPPYMVGIGPMPTYTNIEALSVQYYTQCLQHLIESVELCLDEGLGLSQDLGTELDLGGLLRMDTASKVKAAADSIGAGFLTPNEARQQFDLAPVPGGDAAYLQQQNWSLEALNRRDAQPPAPVPPRPAARENAGVLPEEAPGEVADVAAALGAILSRSMVCEAAL